MCFLMLSGGAIAQQNVIDHCKQTSSDTDRIACLEAAILGKTSEPAPEAQTDLPNKEFDAGSADEPLPRPAAGAVPIAAETVETAPPAIEPQGIGAEQVMARTETREEAAERLEKVKGLPVASYETVPYERLQITLENGQVWRQIKGEKQKIKVDLRRNQTVDIEKSGLGGYRLHLNEMRRTVRVERVK